MAKKQLFSALDTFLKKKHPNRWNNPWNHFWFHENCQNFNFASKILIKTCYVTNFRNWNFDEELFEINFKCWNMENFDLFGDLSTNFLQNRVARRNFFIRKSSKTAFFSFRKITILQTRKSQKLRLLTKTPLTIHANACKSTYLFHSWTKFNSQIWARIMENVRLFLNFKNKSEIITGKRVNIIKLYF